jgi:hypothetical protein
MPSKPLSTSVQALLDSIVANEGDLWISAQQAAEICGTTSRIRVKDMSERQLLCYALLSTYGIAQRLGRTFQAAQAQSQLEHALQGAERPRRLTRAQRRAQERELAKARTRAARKSNEGQLPIEGETSEASEVETA